MTTVTLPEAWAHIPVNPPGLLAGKSVLVTGGSRGIGLACVEEVLACGGSVTLAARNSSEVERAAERLRTSFGDRVVGTAADVSHPKQAARLVEEATERFGALDGVVHAAAVQGPIGKITEVDGEEWLAALQLNLFGTFLIAQAAARAMNGKGGRIVLYSGGGATAPFPNYSAYACSKAAVVRLAETLAVELAGEGITVNCVAPGFVATRIHEATLQAGARAGPEYLARTQQQLTEGGVPAEVAARATAFLLSDAAARITGKLVAAPWDAWWAWPDREAELASSDLFTLRRIVPRDRGGDWQ